MKGRLIIFSGPSGTGKSSIIRLLHQSRPELNLGFSVSATSRPPRPGEEEGKAYYFLSPEEFKKLIDEDKFLEWEEVYEGNYYGTLKSEIDRLLAEGYNVVLDIDVKGGMNVKKIYGPDALAVFIKPPSLDDLESRLRSRNTESEASLRRRLQKAMFELSYADRYDEVVVNGDLACAADEVARKILNFNKEGDA